MISASIGVGGRQLGTEIASPQERQTDAACAAQDGAARSLEDIGRTAPRADAGKLDRLRDDPGALGRFGAV